MNWQQLLTLAIVLGVAVIFVWRGSNPRRHDHGCNCGCSHENEAKDQKENVPH